MKFLFKFFIPLVFLSSCLPIFCCGIPQKEQIVGQILQKLGKKINKEYNLRIVGTNIGMPGGVVGLLGLEFESNRVLTK